MSASKGTFQKYSNRMCLLQYKQPTLVKGNPITNCTQCWSNGQFGPMHKASHDQR